ncbi:MAG: hypothetical protein RL001_2031 [Pseudomonadota bacterium]|jgi:uncharacterized protein (TIGR00730 family)|nr:TIGR00730 family Rossman fold protein [Oxalobacteraceae bacterium]
MTTPFRSVCVYCGASSGHDPLYAEAARALGREMAQQQLALVYGGGHVGLMGIIADTVLEAGGEVTGVIPKALMDTEVGHDRLTRLLVVKDMHERKALMAEQANGFIAMPGGIGTLEELFEAMTWAQLGFHEKPVGLLNVNGFYDKLLAFLSQLEQEGFLRAEHRNLLINESEPSALLERLREFRMPEGVSWLSRQAARTLGP